MGATADRIELYVTATDREPLEDLAAAVERLVRMHTSARAPTVAQVLDSSRDARRARLDRSEVRQIPAETSEQASGEDMRRLRELGDRGWFWCSRTGVFRQLSKRDLCSDLERPGKFPCHRSDVNSAWLAHVKGEPDAPVSRLKMAEQAQLGEVPF